MAKKVRNNKSGSSGSLSKKQPAGRKLARLSTSTRNKNQQSIPDRPFQAPTTTRRAQRGSKSFVPKQSILTLHRMERAEGVLADMLGNPSLSFTASTRKRNVDARWVLKH